MEFQIIGEDTKVSIDVVGRSHPHCTNYWDINWVKSMIVIDIPGYSANYEANFKDG